MRNWILLLNEMKMYIVKERMLLASEDILALPSVIEFHSTNEFAGNSV